MADSYTLVAPQSEPYALPELTDDQRRILDVARDGGVTLVVGGPGTGKTTALIGVVIDALSRGISADHIVVVTASRPQAQELRRRIVDAYGHSLRGLLATTVHGMCQAILQDADVTFLTGPEQDVRVRDLLASTDSYEWPELLRPALKTREFIRELRRVLARARQFGLEPADLRRIGASENRPEWVSAGNFFERYVCGLNDDRVLDYFELVHHTRELFALSSGDAIEWASGKKLVVCDELAELDPSMTHVVMDVCRVGATFVGFADPDTRVFGFRGADPRLVPDFERRYCPDATRIVLSQNLRSRTGIVAALNHVASRIGDQGAGRSAPNVVDDAVTSYVFADEADQAEWIAQDLRRAHLRDQVPWSKMAVIGRFNAEQMTWLSRKLAANGIPVHVAGDDLALGEEPAVRHLMRVVEMAADLAEDRSPDDDTLIALLCSPLFDVDRVELAAWRRAEADESQPAFDENRVGKLANGAVELVSRISGELRRLCSASEALRLAFAGTSWGERLRAESLAGTWGSQRANRDLDAIIALFDVAARNPELVGVDGVRALIKQVSEEQVAADTSRESRRFVDACELMTVYRSKGRDWSHVILVGLQEKRWPTFRQPRTVLRSEELASGGEVMAVDAVERLVDERRTFLLAASRAKDTLVLTAVSDGGDARPSRFLEETGTTTLPAQPSSAPHSIEALVAMLRRVATDPNTSSALRGAAIGQLHELRDECPDADPDFWWRSMPRTPDRALTPATIALTPSSVEQLLTCPRQWFLTRKAGGDRDFGSQAEIGTLIHAAIESIEIGAATLEEAKATLEENVDALAFEAPWIQRAKTMRAIQALDRYARWAQTRDVSRVIAEYTTRQRLEINGIEILLSAKLDRIEIGPDETTARIVDFKTGKNAVTKNQAAESDQLGSYQLALSLDDTGEIPSEITGADLVYLQTKKMTSPDVDADIRSQDPIGEQVEGFDSWVHRDLYTAATFIRDRHYPAYRNPECASCAFKTGCPVLDTCTTYQGAGDSHADR